MKFVVALLICQGAGLVGSIFTVPNIPTWYVFIRKPSFTPPTWFFTPVWTLLFLFMGIALFLIWKEGLSTQKVKPAMVIFFIQLILNMSWSFAFFGARSPFAGFIVIILLLVMILINAITFYSIQPVAGLLLIPYFIWVCFAAVLNHSLLLLNT